MVDKYYPSSLVPKQHIMLISTRITADLMKADKILCNLHLRQSSFCYFDWTRTINQVFGGGFSEGGGLEGRRGIVNKLYVIPLWTGQFYCITLFIYGDFIVCHCCVKSELAKTLL